MTPSSTWSFSPRSEPLAQLVDRLRLVAGRLELGIEAERLLDIALRAFDPGAFGDEQRLHGRVKIGRRAPRCQPGNSGAEIPWTREIFPGSALSANKPLIYRE